MADARIIRILSVVDTREYEEHGDKMVPIPGSGDARDCDRCGRVHEVHATVELDSGSTLVVGTGCMSRESAELGARFRRADSTAKRIARLRAELAIHEALAAEALRIRAQAAALPKPEIVAGTYRLPYDDVERPGMLMGDARVPIQTWTTLSERREAVTGAWLSNRERELGWTWKHGAARGMADDLRARIEKAEAAMVELLAAAA